jgi:hypothetical protein
VRDYFVAMVDRVDFKRKGRAANRQEKPRENLLPRLLPLRGRTSLKQDESGGDKVDYLAEIKGAA